MKQGDEQQQIVLDVARDQEVVPYVLPAVDTELSGILGLIDELFDPVAGPFDGVSENA
jgi:hypothetical protein